MPVSTIANRSAAPSVEAATDTPAELASGPSSFAGELGRETALVGRQRDDAARDDRRDVLSSDESVEPPPAADDDWSDGDVALLELLAGTLPHEPIVLSTVTAPNVQSTSAVSGVKTEDSVADDADTTVETLGELLGLPFFVSLEGTAPATNLDPTTGSGNPQPRVDGVLAAIALDAKSLESIELAALPTPDSLPPPPSIPAPSPAAPAPAAEAKAVDPFAALHDVTLHQLPDVLREEVDGFLRVGRRGDRWEAEIRLDPPDLGALHVRLELRGHELHGVIRCHDEQLEPVLGKLLHDLENDLRQQGGEAFFDLFRGAKREGDERARPPTVSAPPRGSDGTPARSTGGAGLDSDRLVDLFA